MVLKLKNSMTSESTHYNNNNSHQSGTSNSRKSSISDSHSVPVTATTVNKQQSTQHQQHPVQPKANNSNISLTGPVTDL